MKFSLLGSTPHESSQPKKKVPNFPLILLTATDDSVTVKAPGISKEYALEEDQNIQQLSEHAALETTAALGLGVCKVKATDETSDEEPFFLVADTQLGELQDFEKYSGEPGEYQVYTYPQSQEKKPLFSLLGGQKADNDFEQSPRFNKRIAGYVAAGLMLGVAVLIPTTGILEPKQEATQEQYQPNPAQLPVEAPAGWGTYAAWKTPINSQSTPYKTRDKVLVASGNTITARNSQTGEPAWSADAGIAVNQFAALTDTRVAVSDGKEVKVLDLDNHSVESTVDKPSEGQVTFGYGAPVVSVSASPVMYVLDDSGAWQKRTIPAGSKIAGAHDGAITAANFSDKTTKIWSISQDSAELPTPVSIKDENIQGCTGVENKTICFAKDKTKTHITSYTIGLKDEKTTAEKKKEVTVGRNVSAGSLMTPEVDTDSGFFLAQGIWVTDEALVDVGVDAKIGEAYAFRNTSENTEKLNSSGDVVATGPKTKAYPAATNDEDTALVVAADPSSPSETYLYGLPANHKE